jgi:hypothetical protein
LKAGNATEHTFPGVLEQLIESIVPAIRETNEPKRQSCGAPYYILTKKEIPVGSVEAKDIGDKDLKGAKNTGNKEQFDRYKASLNNLIFTDYLDFHLYREGQFVTKIANGEVTEKGIKPIRENYERFENLTKDFCTHVGQIIKSSKKLAEMKAGTARLLSEVIKPALTSDENNSEDSTLKDQMCALKQILIHNITQKVLPMYMPKPSLTECLQLVRTTQHWKLSADKKLMIRFVQSLQLCLQELNTRLAEPIQLI